MEKYVILRVIYSLVLGILITVFLGAAVGLTYEEPSYPDDRYDYYLSEYGASDPEVGLLSEEGQSAYDDDWDRKYDRYERKLEDYNRNASLIVVVGAIVFAGISLLVEKKSVLLGDAFLFAGISSAIYASIRASMSDNSLVILSILGITTILTGLLGYKKFEGFSKTI